MRPQRKYAQVVAEQQDRRSADAGALPVGQGSHRSQGLGSGYPQTKPYGPRNALMKPPAWPSRPTAARAISTVGAATRPGNRSHQLAKNRMTHPSAHLPGSRRYRNVTCWTIAARWPLWTPPGGGSLIAASLARICDVRIRVDPTGVAQRRSNQSRTNMLPLGAAHSTANVKN